MPTYKYECKTCSHRFEKVLSILKSDDPIPCEKCFNETLKLITSSNFNLPGDGWPGKNLKIKRQMEKKNERLGVKQNEWKQESGKIPTLAPNVRGERVENWSDASKLAASKGLETSGYEKRAREEKT